MKPWHVKLARDTIKMAIPFPRQARRLKRAFVPYRSDADNDAGLLADGIGLVEALRRHGVTVREADVVEIGAGWVPLLPLVFRAAGARSITTIDQDRLIDAVTLRYAFSYIEENLEKAAARAGYSGWRAPHHRRHDAIEPMLADNAIAYRAPARFEDLPEASADIVVSRAVLEHIPRDALGAIAKHSMRVLRPGGVACHLIDLSDHWEHQDKSISRVNFLQYEDGFWRMTGLNPQNYQNRLRRFEYVEIFRQAGFRMIAVEGEPDPGALEAARHMRICERYRSVPAEELAVLSVTLIGRRMT